MWKEKYVLEDRRAQLWLFDSDRSIRMLNLISPRKKKGDSSIKPFIILQLLIGNKFQASKILQFWILSKKEELLSIILFSEESHSE